MLLDFGKVIYINIINRRVHGSFLDKILPSSKMVNVDGNEVVLTGEEKSYLLGSLKHVFASPTENIYEVISLY